MDWYVLRTISGKEDVCHSIFQKVFPEFEIIYPKRRLGWRKNGRVISLVRPMFEGYLFVSTDKIWKLDHLLRRCGMNTAWLTRSAGSLVPIFAEEKQLIQRLIGNTGIAEISELERSKDQVKVVNGPLIGLEHVIRKISGRNRRITAEFPVLGEKKKIELEGYIINSEQKELLK